MSNTDKIINEVNKVIHGKDNIIKLTLAAVLARGHVLLEDIPGVGKTTMAMSFSRAMNLDYRRVQFTPDVLPSDLTGFNMYDKNSDTFRFQEGSIYTNLFLADEINRTSPKTQSALLEVMEEGRVTVEGVTRKLPEPFFVIATQNPFGSSGTQKLPESQLDRFMVCLSIGYPDSDNAKLILKGHNPNKLDVIEKITDKEQITQMQKDVDNIFVDDSIYDYIIEITEKTRRPEIFELGLSPRGSLALLQMSKAYAYLNGRDYMVPEDVSDVFLAVAMHRVKLSHKSRAAGMNLEEVLTNSLKAVNVPKLSK